MIRLALVGSWRPNYYPLDNGTLYFFRVQGELLAQRLVRLFDRGVKPYVEREDETRVRASFSAVGGLI